MNILRTCIVTKQNKNPIKMIRVNVDKLGEVAIDYDQKLQGRGAYLSLKIEYVKLVQKKKLLDKKLKTRVPEEIYQTLLKFVLLKNNSKENLNNFNDK
ncbi:YlxR family protein [Candidatus Phytoplasma solani]|uniref:YlxR family protein n=1 Tax=Candidatus Phytoplasma solani TaxID=69896 RepID=UPI0032DA0115